MCPRGEARRRASNWEGWRRRERGCGMGDPRQTLREEEDLAGRCLGYTVTERSSLGVLDCACEIGIYTRHLDDPARRFYEGGTVTL